MSDKEPCWECPKCKKSFLFDVPLMTSESSGFQTAIHDCGPSYWSARLRPDTQEAKDFWGDFLDMAGIANEPE